MKLKRVGKRIVAQSEFYEKDALKAAGFRWSPSDRYWWTPSVENAAQIAWSQRQAQAAKRLVKKYHRQLPHEIYAEIYPEGESK